MPDNTIMQFNWRRHWQKKVVPYLQDERVQTALDLGMSLCEPTWKRGDAPYECGDVTGRVGVKGKLSWYQPFGCCHFIAPFSMVIGVINFPRLGWKILRNGRHSVPVGYGADGKPRVVMDILNSDWFSAEQSIEFADPTIPDEEYWATPRKFTRRKNHHAGTSEPDWVI